MTRTPREAPDRGHGASAGTGTASSTGDGVATALRRENRSCSARDVTAAATTTAPSHWVPVRVLPRKATPDDSRRQREGQLGHGRPAGGGAAQAPVVEPDREQAGDEAQRDHHRRVLQLDGQRVAEGEHQHQRGGQAEQEAQDGEVAQPDLGADHPAEHGAGGPQGGSAHGQPRGEARGHGHLERVREGQQPGADERRDQEHRVPQRDPLLEQPPGHHHGDHRLELLQHHRRDRGAVLRGVDERLREQHGGERRRAGADDQDRGLGAGRRPAERAQRGQHPRQRHQDDDHVLEEHDGRGGVRAVDQRQPQQRVAAPQGGAEGHQPGGVAASTGGRAVRHGCSSGGGRVQRSRVRNLQVTRARHDSGA